jgi:hypothetical protein
VFLNLWPASVYIHHRYSYLPHMNPNLRIFFKRSAYVLVFAIGIAAVVYGVRSIADFDMSALGGYLADGFLWFMVALMSVFVTGFLLRAVWTGIMNRTDTIEMCCPDKTQDGVHIVGSHYHPGGESTDGFSSYFHYYLDLNGKLYLSKRVENDGRELSKSILHLAEQTRLPLDPDLTQHMRIGSYDDEDKKGKDTVIPVSRGQLHIRGYEGLLDYGFKISFYANDQRKWRVKI